MENNPIGREGYSTKRILWLDFARCFAIISISLNHAVNRSYSVYGDQYAEFCSISLASSAFEAIMSIISRIGVPFFLMISGALLLKRDYSEPDEIKRFYKHNWLPLFITTEIWLVIMYVCLSVGDIMSISGIRDVVKLLVRLVMTMCFVNQKTLGSMWYMPMILCVYMMIPVLGVAVKKVPVLYIAIPTSVVILCSFIVPNANAFLRLLGKSSMLSVALEKNFSRYIVYLLFGYYISIGLMRKIDSKYLILGIIVLLLGSSGYQMFAFSRPTNYIMAYQSFGVLATSVCCFEACRRYCDREFRFQKTIAYISKISFGIYFVHICIMTLLCRFPITSIQPLKVIILEVVSVVGSILIIRMTSGIPLLQKYLYGIKS